MACTMTETYIQAPVQYTSLHHYLMRLGIHRNSTSDDVKISHIDMEKLQNSDLPEPNSIDTNNNLLEEHALSKTICLVPSNRSSEDSIVSNSSSSSSPSKKAKNHRRSVRFNSTLITNVSRRPTHEEHTVLYNFERHAWDCQSCKAAAHAVASNEVNPYFGTSNTRGRVRSFRRSRDCVISDAAASGADEIPRLCDEGIALATSVEKLRLVAEGDFLYVSDSSEGISGLVKKGGLSARTKNWIRVEVPHNYWFCLRLVKGAV